MSRNHSSFRFLPVIAAAFVPLLVASCGSTPRETDAVSAASSAAGARPIAADEIAALGGSRRALVVFFSQGEATARVAEDLALLLGADIERIEERKTRGTGFFGFMGAGMFATFGWTVPIKTISRDPSTYDILVVCTPVWAWNLSPPVRAWLRPNRGKLPQATAFVTVSGDTDPAKIAAAMGKESGGAPVAVVGFAERDFAAANRGAYLDKLRAVLDGLR